MKKWICRMMAVVASVVALEVALARLLRHPRGRTLIRAFKRRVLNPLMVKKAGRGNWYASSIETTGPHLSGGLRSHGGGVITRSCGCWPNERVRAGWTAAACAAPPTPGSRLS